jgi:hypothetical protein
MESVQRRCYACDETKPLSEFVSNRRGTHGRSHECKTCAVKRKREYIEKHRVEVRERERRLFARRYTERKAHGVCTKCGKCPSLSGMAQCRECGEKNRRHAVDRPYGVPRERKPDPRRTGARQKRATVKVERPSGCALCGIELIDLHHIDENYRNTDPLNLIPLCPNHHRMVHRGLLCIIPRRQ